MKDISSFLLFFYILDQGYEECKEDDLGGFLGAISPAISGDGRPLDEAIFNDWLEFSDLASIDKSNIVDKAYVFLDHYEKSYNYDFNQIKQWLLEKADKLIIEKAVNEVKKVCQKYDY